MYARRLTYISHEVGRAHEIDWCDKKTPLSIFIDTKLTFLKLSWKRKYVQDWWYLLNLSKGSLTSEFISHWHYPPKTVQNHYPEHLFFWWILLRILISHIFWSWEKLSEIKPPFHDWLRVRALNATFRACSFPHSWQEF